MNPGHVVSVAEASFESAAGDPRSMVVTVTGAFVMVEGTPAEVLEKLVLL